MNEPIEAARAELLKRFETLKIKRDILKAPELRSLYAAMKDMPADQRPTYGQAVNRLRQTLEVKVGEAEAIETAASLTPIDVTAPFDTNTSIDKRPHLLAMRLGSIHPLMRELQLVLDIFYRMGFTVVESRQIDDDYHMFGSLNFPEGHPARDDYDTFMTVQTDAHGKP